jgi:GNAT superfamily N-acetyltransferase
VPTPAVQDQDGPAHASGGATGLRTVTLAERPDLASAVPAVLASRWPAFMLAARAEHGLMLGELLAAVAQHQILLVDQRDQVLAAALSVPLSWDRTVDGLPPGWDGAVSRAADLAARGGRPNAVATLSITMTPAAAGRGLAARMLDGVRTAAAARGIDALIAPVRPVLKAQYPLTTMASYLSWRTPDGEVFDPWLRMHLRLGGVQVGIAYPSRTLRGPVAAWEEWAELPMPAAGEYVIPGGLVPLTVDRRADLATYREPAVWFVHRTAA